MPLRTLTLFGTLALNFAFALIYNKAQGRLGASLLPVSIVGLGVLGAVLYLGRSARTSPASQIGWGLMTASLVSVALCVCAIAWIVLYMRG